MTIRTNSYSSGEIEVRVPKTDGVFSSTSTDGVLLVSMPPEKWLEVWAAVRRKIDEVQMAENKQEIGDMTADLAAKIEQHGAAS